MEHVGINETVVKGLSKEEFLDQMKHHANDVDLEAEYNRIHAIQPEKKVKAAEKQLKE